MGDISSNLKVDQKLCLVAGDKDTNGHVDNFCCFVKPGEVLLHWVDDKSDPQYERSLEAFDILSKTTDAKGRTLNILKIHAPGPLYYTREEVAGLEVSLTSLEGFCTRVKCY